MTDQMTVIINSTQSSNRLDKVLADALPDISRSRLKALITDGQVMCDAKGEKETILSPKHKVKEGEIYTINIPEAVNAEPQGENISLDIVYEDAHLIVINKPAGMVVHPASGALNGTLVNALLHHCGDSLSGIGGVKRPGIVHRIDKDTSGLLVVAKDDKTHVGLSKQFEAHTIERLYTAVVRGMPSPLDGRIQGDIARHPKDRKRMAITLKGGKWAATNYRSLQHFTSGGNIVATEIECKLETGRTHQIRVHLTSVNCPLVGDTVYGKAGKLSDRINPQSRAAIQSFKRQALHARVLGFIHPITDKALKFETKLPNDMCEMIEALKAASR
jgi:23S rRNA pseudouridine1911/1915/1917 synthase